ncbi:hypothetical protein [Sphingobacterium phlebotomi]|nr:hypothetical protein [Sphingobacterium phlebotomi]
MLIDADNFFQAKVLIREPKYSGTEEPIYLTLPSVPSAYASLLISV